MEQTEQRKTSKSKTGGNETMSQSITLYEALKLIPADMFAEVMISCINKGVDSAEVLTERLNSECPDYLKKELPHIMKQSFVVENEASKSEVVITSEAITARVSSTLVQ